MHFLSNICVRILRFKRMPDQPGMVAKFVFLAVPSSNSYSVLCFFAMAGNPGAGQISHFNTVSLKKQLHHPDIVQPHFVSKCSSPYVCTLSPSPPQTQSELLQFASVLLAITSLRSVVATLRTDPLDPLDALTTTFGLGSVGTSLGGKASFRLFLRPGPG